MKLIKNFSLSLISTLVRLIASYASIKVVAYYLGVEGVAVQSNYVNIVTIIMTIGSLSLETGTIITIAKYEDDKEKLFSIASSILKICFFSTVSVCLIFIALNLVGMIPLLPLKVAFGLILIMPIITMGSISMAIINGLKEFTTYYLINIVSAVLTLILSFLLIYYFRTTGLYVAAVATYVITGCNALYFIFKRFYQDLKNCKFEIIGEDRKSLISLSIMGLFSSVLLPFNQVLIRDSIITNFSIHMAGIWDSANKLSSLFIVTFNMTFQVYFLSKLSSLKKLKEVFDLIKVFYLTLLPILLIYMLFFHFGYDFFIKIVFTPSFKDVKSFYPYQQIGDAFRVVSYIFGYLLWIHKKIYYYIFIESVYLIILYTLSNVLGEIYGFQGFAMAYMITAGVYFILLLMYRRLLFKLYEV